MEMKRLTKKHKPTNYTRYTETTICLKNYNIRSANLNKAIEKLGKLEDLEEELGCPLEALIRGFIDSNELNDDCDYKQKIMTYNCGGKLIEGFEMELSYGKNIDIAVCGEDNNNDYDIETITVQIKDYGKTWWIKGEKNENKINKIRKL